MCCFDWLVRSLCKRERPRPEGPRPEGPVLVYPEFALDVTRVAIPKSGRRYCACDADCRIGLVDKVQGRYGSLSKAFRFVQPDKGGIMTRCHIRELCSDFYEDEDATELADIYYQWIKKRSKSITEKAFCNFFEPYIEITLEFEKDVHCEASTPKSSRKIVNPESVSGTCSAQASSPTTAPSTPPKFEGPLAPNPPCPGGQDPNNFTFEDLSSGLPAALPVSKAAPKAETKGPLDVAEEDAGPSVAVPAVKAPTADRKGACEEESLLGDGHAPKTNVEGPKAVKDEAGWQEVVQAASDAARAAWFPPDEAPREAAESASREVAKDAVRHRKTGEEVGLAVKATIRAADAMPVHRQASAAYRVLRGHGPSGAPEFVIVTTQQLG